MCVTNQSLAIDDGHKRHAPQFEQVDFLTVLQRNPVAGIGQSDEPKPLGPPVCFKGFRSIGTDRKDLGASPRELIVIVPQARQLRAAVGSEKAPEERQDQRLATEVG